MVGGGGETDGFEYFPSSRGREHHNRGRLAWIEWVKEDSTVVESALEAAPLETGEGEMPLEKVILEWIETYSTLISYSSSCFFLT